MAVKSCKECGGQVSTKAKACPQCGAKAPKQTSFITWAVLVVIVLVVGNSVLNPAPPAPQKTPEQIAQEAEKARLEAAKADKRLKEVQAVGLAKASVKARLKDPSSAEFGKVVMKPSGIVCGYVNAKNAYGGYTGEKAFISMGSQEMTWLEGESPDFATTWNKNCAS